MNNKSFLRPKEVEFV